MTDVFGRDEDTSALATDRRAEAWDKVRSIEHVVAKYREEGARGRRLPDSLYAAFVSNDLYRLLVPLVYGGPELDPLTFFDLVEEMSSYDGSTGWNFGIGASGIAMLSGLSAERMRDLFASPHSAFAGSGAVGKAVATEGGYMVGGRWGWGSNIHHASIVGVNVMLFDGDRPRIGADGKPMLRLCLLPRNRIEVLDTWFTEGLEGTGSSDFEAVEVYVPEEDLVIPFGNPTGDGSAILRLPVTYFGLVLAAVALGIARGAAGDLIQLARQQGSPLTELGYVHYAVAKAQALQEAASVNVRESFRPLWENACRKAPQKTDQRARARRAYCHAVESAIEAVRLCNEAAGSAAVFSAHGFARAMRDVHAVRGHAILSRRFMELSGKASLGLPVEHPLF